MKEELDIKEKGIKEEIVFIKKDILPSSTVEETCTVYVQEEDVEMDNASIKGKLSKLGKTPFRYKTDL